MGLRFYVIWSLGPKSFKHHLESQVAQNERQLYLEVAHNSVKVAHNYGPLAVQGVLRASGVESDPNHISH